MEEKNLPQGDLLVVTSTNTTAVLSECSVLSSYAGAELSLFQCDETSVHGQSGSRNSKLLEISKENFLIPENQTYLPDLQKTKETPPENFKRISQALGRLTSSNSIREISSGSLLKLIPQLHNQQVSLGTIGNWRSSGSYIDLQALRPEDLPELTLPVLEFIEQIQPHIVIGCDRGGRLFSLALHAAWRHTRGATPFPTIDGKIHFARISKSEDEEVLQESVDRIVEQCLVFGKQRGNVVKEGEQLRVLYVDDWVVGGGTKRLAKRLMKKHQAQTYFAVMSGNDADVSGDASRSSGSVSWHDSPAEIGVNYLSSVAVNTDGSVTERLKAQPVRGRAAQVNRQKIQAASRNLVLNNLLGGAV